MGYNINMVIEMKNKEGAWVAVNNDSTTRDKKWMTDILDSTKSKMPDDLTPESLEVYNIADDECCGCIAICENMRIVWGYLY